MNLQDKPKSEALWLALRTNSGPALTPVNHFSKTSYEKPQSDINGVGQDGF